MRVRATAPGRVNLIGDHTDYTGGLVLPMAIDRSVVVEGVRTGQAFRLSSRQESGEAMFPLTVQNPGAIFPPWGRFLAAVASVVGPAQGFSGEIRSTIPVGAGLSSSAALCIAGALAFGFEGSQTELAAACRAAEQVATGVPCGIMDQLASAAGVEGHALLIDCTTLNVTPVPVPGDVEVWVFHSGQARRLAASPYAERRAQCEAATAVIGPLASATVADLAAVADPLVRARARHVVTENERVRAFVAALRAGELAAAGELMTASHASLRDDFAVSTPALDALVGRLVATEGVLGARLTGAGFGGCAVALVRPGARLPAEGWRAIASAGARAEEIASTW